MRQRTFLILVALLFGVIGVLPVISMFFQSITLHGNLSWDAYRQVLTSSRQWELMANSFSLSLLVMALTTLAGVPLGILFGKSDLPLRRFFLALLLIPLLIPPYITAISWFDLLGREGVLARVLGPDILTVSHQLLFGLPGCVLVLFTTFLPIPVILTMVYMQSVHPHLEEAGRLVAGWKQVLWRITLPLIRPGILLAAMLTFLLSFGEFGVPNFLRYEVFPVESFTQFSAFYNFKAATASAMPLVLVALVVLLAEAKFLRGQTDLLRPAAENEARPRLLLGRFRTALFLSVGMLSLVLVIVPFFTLLLRSLDGAVYTEALHRAGDSLSRSLLYAVSGATLLTILGFFTAYLIRSEAVPFKRTVDFTTIFLFALPGTVVGIGLISLWNTPYTNFIYGTIWIILFGYLAKYTALTSRITVNQLAQIPRSMEEAARVAGAGWFRRLLFIVAPLARRGLVAAWIVGYIFSLRDTGITMLVYPAGHDTLPVRIFTLMANGSAELIAALSVILIAVTLLPAGLLWVLFNFKNRKIQIWT